MKILQPEFSHKDERRTLTQLFTSPIAQVNEYFAKKGSVLGNHYHKETYEYFYIAKGKVVYNDQFIFKTGGSFLVEPGELHTLICLTDVTMLTFLTKPYSKEEPDTYK